MNVKEFIEKLRVGQIVIYDSVVVDGKIIEGVSRIPSKLENYTFENITAEAFNLDVFTPNTDWNEAVGIITNEIRSHG